MRRLWRHRVAGGVAVLAVAGLGAAVLPAVLDDDRDNVASADGAGDPAGYPPQVGADPVKQRMWDAIESALPADVEVVPAEDLEHEVVPETGPSVEVTLTRGGRTSFDLAVTLEPTRTDLPEYRPCSEPGLFDGVAGQWLNCEDGRDDDGVYRAAGDLNGLVASAVLAENDDVSVTVRWNVRPLSPTGSDQPAPDDPLPMSALDRAEGEAIGDAVLAAAAGLDPADLTSGVELAAVAEAWPEMTNVLEEAVGAELTAVGPEVPVVDLQDAEHQAGTVSAEYVTDDGLELELWFRQRPRVSEPMCVDRIMWCLRSPAGSRGWAARVVCLACRWGCAVTPGFAAAPRARTARVW
ncbi:hypothetical protein [Jiangella ureilytica]|uniref:hypothetical protein n=1 Tax=Jiangella ureilytica TaxID=2530374 RepID=UPI0010471748|nr:hypothetical protein [Jiangella ureilytica]